MQAITRPVDLKLEDNSMRIPSLSYSTLLIFVVCICASIAYPQKGTAASPPPLGKLVDVGGYRVHLYCTGTGSPAVIIAGAGYSFDWGLVQPEVAKFTEVCAYDHSGIAWSDSGPADSCALRVHEIHTALRNAGVKGPYVLVGHSLGALVVRLYAAQYPDETAGLLFAEHAFGPFGLLGAPAPLPPSAAKSDKPVAAFSGMDHDPNFNRLDSDDQQFHRWAESQNKDQTALRTNTQITPQCFAEAEAVVKKHPQPLGNRPLVDISVDSHMPGYARLHSQLLSLSSDSKQIVAENSGHFVIIDRPEVVVDGIREVVNAVRTKTKVSVPKPLP